jgi:hypothetical protein
MGRYPPLKLRSLGRESWTAIPKPTGKLISLSSYLLDTTRDYVCLENERDSAHFVGK